MNGVSRKLLATRVVMPHGSHARVEMVGRDDRLRPHFIMEVLSTKLNAEPVHDALLKILPLLHAAGAPNNGKPDLVIFDGDMSLNNYVCEAMNNGMDYKTFCLVCAGAWCIVAACACLCRMRCIIQAHHHRLVPHMGPLPLKPFIGIDARHWPLGTHVH